MRILFMGTPGFAVPSLQMLLEHEYSVVSVVTAPDKPRGRGQQMSYTPVKQFALERHLPLLQPNNLKDLEFAERIRLLHVDLMVVVAFRILPREIYTLPARGSFNLHASLLPKYRGAAPINWAIINGERETGVTTFFLQDKVDTGSIILQSKIPINDRDTAGEIHDKLASVGAQLVLATVKRIESGSVELLQQNDSMASPAPKIFKEHCRIDWNKPAVQIHNFIRGLSPHPTAWTLHNGKTLKMYRSMVLPSPQKSAGTVIHVSPDALQIGTQDGTLSITEIQQEGKRRLDIKEFLRGYKVHVGDQFE